MSRRQFIVFVLLLIVCSTTLSLSTHTKIVTSSRLSLILLFPIRSISGYVQYLGISGRRIHDLEVRIQQLQLQNAELQKRIAVDGLDSLATPYDLYKAHIIGRDPSNINGYLYIDKGTHHGLATDQPVVSIDGLIGKIRFVNADYSIVETIEHEGFAVSAIDIQTGIHGIVRKNTFLLFDYIRSDDTLFLDDIICTSGMSEMFPEGIPIGRVQHIGEPQDPFFKPVYLSPEVKINRLTYVYVILGYEQGELSPIPVNGSHPSP